jgi:hypothetical protein
MRFNQDFLIGIARGVAYYTVGAVLVFITYLAFGWQYAHAPAAHHMVGLLVLVIGAVLLIRRLIGLLTEPQNMRNKGALLMHAIAVVSFILFFKLIILNGAVKRDTGEHFAVEAQAVKPGLQQDDAHKTRQR